MQAVQEAFDKAEVKSKLPGAINAVYEKAMADLVNGYTKQRKLKQKNFDKKMIKAKKIVQLHKEALIRTSAYISTVTGTPHSTDDIQLTINNFNQ